MNSDISHLSIKGARERRPSGQHSMASTECPICSRHVRAENLELHVEGCLQKSSAEEKRRKRAQELATPLFSPISANRGASQQQSRRHSFPSAPATSSGNDATKTSSALPSPVQSKKRKREHPATSSAPLAERMRPTSLDDLLGQEELLGPGKLLSSLIQADRVPNMILWG